MDLLDRLLGHDADTTRGLLVLSRGLSDAQLDRAFAIGHSTLRATFAHVIGNMEAWTDLICGRPVRPRVGEGEKTVARLIGRLDAAAAEFGAAARRIRDEGRLDELFCDTADRPPRMKTFGGAIAHLITHSMHHRAQILNIMRQLGLKDLPEGDALSWERGRREGGWPVGDGVCSC
jgi:uncharacterized damage-inducible protein DinB